MRWIIEEDFDENILKIKDECESQGIECLVVPFRHLGRNFGPEPTIFYGSQRSVRFVQNDKNWYVYCTWENYNCQKYYEVLHPYLFNQDYIITHPGNVFLKKDFYTKCVGNPAFVRPVDGYKSFSGVFDLGQIPYHNRNIVLSTVKETKPEFRYLVCDGIVRAVGNAQGLNGAQHKDIVEEITDLYKPDSCFCVDMIDDKLVEISSFACAGLYNMNITDVVYWVTNTAHESMKDIYEENNV